MKVLDNFFKLNYVAANGTSDTAFHLTVIDFILMYADVSYLTPYLSTPYQW